MIFGALSGAVAVAAGAFASHFLENRLDAHLYDVFQTAAQYQMYHALALLAVAFIASRWPGALIRAAGWLFVAGSVVFAGSLYAYTLSGVRSFALVTPLGGISFIAGWVCVALAARRI